MHEIFSKDTTVFPRVLLSCMLSSTDTFKKGETGLSPRKYITEQKLHSRFNCIIHKKIAALVRRQTTEMTINSVGISSFKKPKVKRRYYRHQSSHLFDEKILVKISAIHKKYIKINLQTILKGSAKSQI